MTQKGSEGPEVTEQAPLPPAQAQPPRSLPPVDMIQTMQASGGPGFFIAAKGLDARMPDTARRVPSARAGGETRTQSLKRKAEHISRSASEIFAFCTSETVSQEGTAKLLSAVGNVSCTYINMFGIFNIFYIFLRNMYNLHILHILHILYIMVL